MKLELCHKCLVYLKNKEKIEAWIEINDHGLDLKFYERTTRKLIDNEKIDKWEIWKDREYYSGK